MADETTQVENAEVEAAVEEETFAHKAIKKFKKVAIFLVIAVAIALIISIISQRQESAKIDSWNKILEATFTAKTTNGDVIADLSKATKEIPGTPGAQYGDMLIIGDAGITYEKSKLELAKSTGEDFIKSNPNHPFINQVKLDYGTVLFNLEDYNGAVKAYTDVVNAKVAYLETEALFFKGLALEKLGKDEEAIQTYTAVVNDITNKVEEKKLLNKNTGEEYSILSVISELAAFSRAKLQDKIAN